MTGLRLLATILLGASLSVAAVDQSATPARDQQKPARGSAALKGSVVDAQTGAPIRRAAVTASSSEVTGGRSAVTDADGRFDINELPSGKYALTASRTGFLRTVFGQRRTNGTGTLVQVVDGQTVEKIAITMSRGGVIAGRVFDEFGDPVSGAEVRALQYRFDGGARRLLPGFGDGASIRTDDLGGFRLYGLQPGQYYVSARPTNIFPIDGPGLPADATGPTTTLFPNSADPAGAQRLTVSAGRETGPLAVILVSSRMARIRGRAVTSTGEPFTPAFVQLSLRDSPGTTNGTGVRPDGLFEVPRVTPGSYHITVRPSNWRSDDDQEVGRATVTVAGEDVDEVLVVGARPAIARGRIVSDDGTPLPLKPQEIMVSMSATSLDDRYNGTGNGRVAADYTFEMRGLFGTQLVRVFATNSTEWTLKAVVLNGEDVTDSGIDFEPNRVVDGLELVLTRGTTHLSGSVTNDRGEPVVDMWVVVFPSDENRWTWQARFVQATPVTADGTYRFQRLPPYSEYLMAIVQDMENGQWQDPEFLRSLRDRATRVSLAEGETKIQNLRVAGILQ